MFTNLRSIPGRVLAEHPAQDRRAIMSETSPAVDGNEQSGVATHAVSDMMGKQ